MALKDGQKYSIISWVDHYVLDVRGGAPKNSTEVINFEWKQTENQKFQAISKGDGYFLLKPVRQEGNSNRVLDEASGKLITYDAHGNPNQQWTVEPIRPGGFVCYIKSRKSGNVLQRDGHSQVRIVPKDSSNKDQLWIFAEATS